MPNLLMLYEVLNERQNTSRKKGTRTSTKKLITFKRNKVHYCVQTKEQRL